MAKLTMKWKMFQSKELLALQTSIVYKQKPEETLILASIQVEVLIYYWAGSSFHLFFLSNLNIVSYQRNYYLY